MKKGLKLCLYIALFLLVGVVVWLVVTNKIDYEKALDYIYYGAGAVTVVVIVLSPVIKNVIKAKNAIDEATSNTTEQNKNNLTILTEVENYKNKLVELADKYNEKVKEISELKQDISDLKEMCRLAFMNQNELVSKGVAREIAKVGVEHENNEGKE